jgi:hypothetical protein
MKRVLALIALLALAGAGCGAEKSALADAQEGLGEVKSGVLALKFTAGTGDGGGVGFSLNGPFDLRGKAGDLPKADLTYDRVGVQARPVTFTSDGRTARVGSVELSGAQLDQLRLTDGDDADGVAGLHLKDWATGKATRTDGRVESDVDPVKALNDVFTLAGQFGDGGVTPIEGKAADRLREAVSEARVVVEQGPVYTMRLDIRFAPEAGEKLREALGAYAAPWLRLDLRIENPEP